MNQQKTLYTQINNKACTISQIAFIYEEIAKRMIARLDYIKITPENILDIGSGLGIDTDLLRQKYPKTSVYELDFAVNLLKKRNLGKSLLHKFLGSKNKQLICADAMNTPFKPNYFDIVWSNLALPYVNDYTKFFKEIRTVLKLGGCFLISGLGVDSLEQIREVGLRTYNFPDMHMLGDILVKLGFSNPVTDMEKITLEYDNFNLLLNDLRVLGCGNIIEANSYLSKDAYLNLQQKFAALTQNGAIPLTLEIFYAHAWKDKVTLDLPPEQKVIKFTKSVNTTK